MLMNSLDATALSQTKAKAETTVAVFYFSDYGYSDRLSVNCYGITKTGVNVEMIDLRSAEPQEVQELISRCAGIVIGMPQLRLELLPQPKQLSVQFSSCQRKASCWDI